MSAPLATSSQYLQSAPLIFLGRGWAYGVQSHRIRNHVMGGCAPIATIRRTNGVKACSVGNVDHDGPYVIGRMPMKAAVGLELFEIEIAETTKIIGSGSTSGARSEA